MAMKVVVVLFIAMVVLTEHNAMAGTLTCLAGCAAKGGSPDNLLNCLIGCGTPCSIQCAVNNKTPEDVAKCLADCGTPCPAKCARDSTTVPSLAVCLIGCFSPFVTHEDIQTPDRTTTVCTVGCSLGICSQFLNDEEMFGACMKSCGNNHCAIGGNYIASSRESLRRRRINLL
ncbi:hypothetical protein FXO38_05236 [Capsicum annuum]|uniref:uncharacterized protein LOC107844911 n=1 Tax=Capsicum annuum TaxID=4072 RepID=UPI001FB15620|nr:uncharacterized protein LOC107844911 [Capsicum annuum]KAF3674392.1 hypothetical protein FXO38_05236 [Capsicum annuum]